MGENGTGKSTLLEALAVAWEFNAEGGTKNFRFTTRASHSPLHLVDDKRRIQPRGAASQDSRMDDGRKFPGIGTLDGEFPRIGKTGAVEDEAVR